jgi:hypothetical protein
MANWITKFSKKVYKRGKHTAHKVRKFIAHNSGKIRHTIHKAKKVVDGVRKYAPIVGNIASTAAIALGQPEIAAGIKGAGTAVSGFNTVSRFLDKTSEKTKQIQDLNNKPSALGFQNLFT